MLKGITRGFDLMLELLRLLVWAVEKQNAEAITDCIAVIYAWYKETTGAALDFSGAVKKSNINVFKLLAGTDPWAGSRAKFQIVANKFIIK